MSWKVLRQSCGVWCVAAIACSSPPSMFPDALTFGSQPLTKGTTWSRGGMSGIVYVPPGEKMPRASLQVGVIVSTDHTTGSALHAWIRDQAYRSGTLHVHDADAPEESCRVAMSPERTYMALEVCRTGVARAACVEADETLDGGTATTCMNNSRCFDDICDQRWLRQREALDRLLADVLAKR
jgi:hypothetical protein